MQFRGESKLLEVDSMLITSWEKLWVFISIIKLWIYVYKYIKKSTSLSTPKFYYNQLLRVVVHKFTDTTITTTVLYNY